MIKFVSFREEQAPPLPVGVYFVRCFYGKLNLFICGRVISSPTFLCEYYGRAHKITLSIVGVGAPTTLKNNRIPQHNRRAHYVR